MRKLLELERMEITPETGSTKDSPSSTVPSSPSKKDSRRHSDAKLRESTELALAAVTIPIPCDDCGERVAAKDVIAHLKNCKVAGAKAHPELWSPSSSTSSRPGSGPSSRSHTESPPSTHKERLGERGDPDTETETNGSERGDNADSPLPQSTMNSSIGSLSALESLVEKSFDKSKQVNKSGAYRHQHLLAAHHADLHHDHRRTPDDNKSAAELEPVKAVLTCKVSCFCEKHTAVNYALN